MYSLAALGSVQEWEAPSMANALPTQFSVLDPSVYTVVCSLTYYSRTDLNMFSVQLGGTISCFYWRHPAGNLVCKAPRRAINKTIWYCLKYDECSLCMSDSYLYALLSQRCNKEFNNNYYFIKPSIINLKLYVKTKHTHSLSLRMYVSFSRSPHPHTSTHTPIN